MGGIFVSLSTFLAVVHMVLNVTRFVRDGEKGVGVEGVWKWWKREVMYLSLRDIAYP